MVKFRIWAILSIKSIPKPSNRAFPINCFGWNQNKNISKIFKTSYFRLWKLEIRFIMITSCLSITYGLLSIMVTTKLLFAITFKLLSISITSILCDRLSFSVADHVPERCGKPSLWPDFTNVFNLSSNIKGFFYFRIITYCF